MAKTKDSIERTKPTPRTSIALHQIRKPLQRTLPWITAAKKGTSNNGLSESHMTTLSVSENDEPEMIDDIYGTQFTDGIYFELN